MKYKRVWIFGGTGTGKSTFAKELSKKIKIPYYTTDEFIYKKDWQTKYTEKQRDKMLNKTANKKQWIIEGVHAGEWIYPAFKKADFVIILSASRARLLTRTIKKFIQRKIKKDSKKQKFKDLLLLLKYSWVYNNKKNGNLIKHKDLIKKYKKTSIILKNQKQINEFLETIRWQK